MDELDFDLPADRIATEPATPRDSARLMVIDRHSGRVEHAQVKDLAQVGRFFQPGDLLVFNQSRVIPARFSGTRAATGGRVGGLYLHQPVDGPEKSVCRVMLESRGTLKAGERIVLTDDSCLTLLGRTSDQPSGPQAGMVQMGEAAAGQEGGDGMGGIEGMGGRVGGEGVGGGWVVRLDSPLDMVALLDRIGQPPLPPYIRKQRKVRHQPESESEDRARYNTIYAREPGSVAAPTAGLHFTPELLDRLQQQGVDLAFVTLHVGLGTFAPVRCDRLEDHVMHREWFHVPDATAQAIASCRQRSGRIIPIGTTTVRALESYARRGIGPAGGSGSAEATGLSRGDGSRVNGRSECGNEEVGWRGGGWTDLFIRPGDGGREPADSFRLADGLLTNFHLPRSTLLALVAALPGVGVDRLLDWYGLAIQREYRFYSYGDAMLILPPPPPP